MQQEYISPKAMVDADFEIKQYQRYMAVRVIYDLLRNLNEDNIQTSLTQIDEFMQNEACLVTQLIDWCIEISYWNLGKYQIDALRHFKQQYDDFEEGITLKLNKDIKHPHNDRHPYLLIRELNQHKLLNTEQITHFYTQLLSNYAFSYLYDHQTLKQHYINIQQCITQDIPNPAEWIISIFEHRICISEGIHKLSMTDLYNNLNHIITYITPGDNSQLIEYPYKLLDQDVIGQEIHHAIVQYSDTILCKLITNHQQLATQIVNSIMDAYIADPQTSRRICELMVKVINNTKVQVKKVPLMREVLLTITQQRFQDCASPQLLQLIVLLNENGLYARNINILQWVLRGLLRKFLEQYFKEGIKDTTNLEYLNKNIQVATKAKAHQSDELKAVLMRFLALHNMNWLDVEHLCILEQLDNMVTIILTSY